MLSAILIDDEQHCNETLRFELKRHCPDVKIVAEVNSGAEAIVEIRRHSPDIIFLDIEMPGMSGFDMLQQFDQISFHIIFVTAYDQYAIQAFRFAAIDYLLKPVISAHLCEAIDKIKSSKAKGDSEEQFQTLLHNIRDGLKSPRMAVPSGRGMDFISLHDILYCVAESNYSHLHMIDRKKYTMSKTLKETELLLTHLNFFRIHQSYIINIDHMQRYMRDDGGYVIMVDGKKIPIAKRRKEAFMSLIK